MRQFEVRSTDRDSNYPKAIDTFFVYMTTSRVSVAPSQKAGDCCRLALSRVANLSMRQRAIHEEKGSLNRQAKG